MIQYLDIRVDRRDDMKDSTRQLERQAVAAGEKVSRKIPLILVSSAMFIGTNHFRSLTKKTINLSLEAIIHLIFCLNRMLNVLCTEKPKAANP